MVETKKPSTGKGKKAVSSKQERRKQRRAAAISPEQPKETINETKNESGGIDTENLSTQEEEPKATTEAPDQNDGKTEEEIIDEEVYTEDDEEVSTEDDDEEVSTEDDELKEDLDFQQLCMDVNTVLRKFPGNRLNCKIKVFPGEKTAIIHQGPRSNIWGRLKSNGDHYLYRHALKKVLDEDELTTTYFKNI